MKIQAYAAKSAKQKLELYSYNVSSLAPYEVLIAVTHCGLCYSDIHLIDNDWNRSIYPIVPGHEVIGKIVKKGDEVTWPIGTRVGVSWQYSSCLECSFCLSGDNQLCLTRKATCIGHHGGLANETVADSRFIYAIPENLSSADAAPLLCAGATVYSPLKQWKIQAPHRVGVIGIGGLGHLAIQFASAFGCYVTAISSTASKKEEAFSFGAKDFLTWKDAAEKTNYFDFILSTSHADLDMDLVCSLLKPNGILCLVGRSSTPASINLLTSLAPARCIVSSSVANRAVMNEMLQFAADHKITPKIEVMPLSKINEAIERVRENKARYRIVLENDYEPISIL